MSYSGTVHCGHCYETGHNKRGCPKRKQFAVENPDSYVARQFADQKARAQKRRCSFCAKIGHNRRGCTEFKTTTAEAERDSRQYRRNFLKYIKDMGLTPGALIVRRSVETYDSTTREYTTHDRQVCQVTDILWDNVDYRAKTEEYASYKAIQAVPVAQMMEQNARDSYYLSTDESASLPETLRSAEARGTYMDSWELASPGSGSAANPPAGFVSDISKVKEHFKDATSDNYHDNKWADS
jgi:hypothetical protein